MRTVLSSRTAHWQEPKKRRRRDGSKRSRITSGKSSRIYVWLVSAHVAKLMLGFLLAFGVPDSLRRIPEKYNNAIHLQTNCFYCLLENLQRSSLTSKIALDYLQEFIYYAHTFRSTQHSSNGTHFWTTVPIGSRRLLAILRDLVSSLPP